MNIKIIFTVFWLVLLVPISSNLSAEESKGKQITASDKDSKMVTEEYYKLIEANKLDLKIVGSRYCHRASSTNECSDCWSALGGEGGRIDCAVRFGPGEVFYGTCGEDRNKKYCGH